MLSTSTGATTRPWADTEGADQLLRIHLIQSPQMNEKHPATRRSGWNLVTLRPNIRRTPLHRFPTDTRSCCSCQHLLHVASFLGTRLSKVCSNVPGLSPVVTTGLTRGLPGGEPSSGGPETLQTHPEHRTQRGIRCGLSRSLGAFRFHFVLGHRAGGLSNRCNDESRTPRPQGGPTLPNEPFLMALGKHRRC